ncbi:Ig-like domain-containing protein, partial [Anaerococcus sp.]
MKNNNSTKKTVTILSLAMVLVLPVTSHADEQTNEEKPLNTQNYMGGGTDSKLEEELSALIDKEKADDKEVSIDKESSDEIESSDIETSNSNIEDKENLAETENIETDNKDLADDVNSEKEDNPKPKENYNSTEKVESDEVVKSEKETEDTLDKNDNEELEISNEFNESQLRTANPSRDISNKLQDVDIKIYDTEERGKLKSVDGEDLGWSISFKAPTDVQPGDEFTITLSDNWSLKGIEPDTDFADPIIDKNGVVIAEGKRTDRNHIVYTFTENIHDVEEISGEIKSHGYDVKEKIKNTQDQTFEISVGDNSNNQTLKVDYGPINVSNNWNANGKSQFISNDENTGEYKQVFYINPNKETITASDNHNISFYIDGVYGEDGAWKKLLYPQDNTTVTVNKVSQNETLPDAVYENPVNYDGDSDTDVIYNFNNTGDIVVDFKSQSIDSSYVVTVTSKAPAGIGPYTLLSKGTIYGNPQREENLVLGNGIINRGGDASGTDIKKRGSFQEHHIYQTVDEEGNVISTDFTNDRSVVTGNVGEEYKTSKIDQPTYTLTEVKPANGAASNTDGSEATGKFVKDKKQEVTYIYKRVQPNGLFQEHHKYITKDQDGKIIETKTEDGDTTKGNTKESYTTSKKEKGEFEFKRIENPIGGPIYSANGDETKGNYKSGIKQEITYVYEKTVEVPKEKVGSFQEHHIYRTLREDGTYIVDERVDGDVTSGKTTDSYKTAQVDRDGYTFNSEATTTKNGATANQGGNYFADKKLEVTYVYDRKESPKESPKDIYEMIEETEDFEQELVENKDLPLGTIKITQEGKNARYRVLYRHVDPDTVPDFNESDFKQFAGAYWEQVSREKIAEGQKQIIQYHLGETPTTPTNPEKPLKPNETNITVEETTKDGVKGKNVTITITNPNDDDKVVKEKTFFVPDGKDGANGEAGKDGQPGTAGQDGKDGKDGQDGKDGKSSSVKVVAGKNDEGKSGHWVITYFDKNGDGEFTEDEE